VQLTKCEVFADILGVGLMCQTPFERYDFFKQIHSDDKAAFKLIVEKLLAKWAVVIDTKHPVNGIGLYKSKMSFDKYRRNDEKA
jgi:hypothetical protein